MTLEPPRSLEHSTIGEYPRLDLLPFHQSGLSSSLGSQDAEGSRFFVLRAGLEDSFTEHDGLNTISPAYVEYVLPSSLGGVALNQ